MNLCTVAIPIASYHQANAQNAIASVHHQSIPCNLVTHLDVDNLGAGVVRNHLLTQVETPFVVFLDADDFLLPTFVEQTLAAWTVAAQPAYVYTDWHHEYEIVSAPEVCPWCNGTWHCISTLLRTEDARRVGGFDELLPALEDSDFYLKLRSNGVRAVHCPQPLMYYTKEGKRSKEAALRDDYQQVRDLLRRRYMADCGICGGGVNLGSVPIPEEKQDGDVLVKALYTPMSMRGTQTGRFYARPKGIYHYRLWVSPLDAQAKPDWWEVIPQTASTNGERSPAAPDVQAVMNMAREALGLLA